MDCVVAPRVVVLDHIISEGLVVRDSEVSPWFGQNKDSAVAVGLAFEEISSGRNRVRSTVQCVSFLDESEMRSTLTRQRFGSHSQTPVRR